MCAATRFDLFIGLLHAVLAEIRDARRNGPLYHLCRVRFADRD